MDKVPVKVDESRAILQIIKNPMRHVFLFSAIFLLSAGSSVFAEESVKSVISKSIEAVGGKDAMLAITSRKSVYEMFIPAMNISAEVTVIQEAPDKLYSKTVMPVPGGGGAAAEQVMVFNGTEGWEISNMGGVRSLSSDEIASQKVQSDFYLLLDFHNRFPESQYKGVDNYHGTQAHVIIANPGTNATTFYFNTDTYLLIGMKVNAVSEIGEMEVNIEAQEFLKKDGVMIPQRMIVRNPFSEIIMQAKVVQHNPELDADVFAVPAELR